MNRLSSSSGRRWLLLSVIAMLCVTLVPGLAPAAAGQTSAPKLVKSASGGFGSSANSYVWSMAWFKRKLYVGTGRLQRCVENATLDFYFPNAGYYVEHPDPETTCPADRWDMDLRAEIWQFTPETNVWALVYRSPTVANPRAPGKSIALDLGYRGMTVHKGALYIGAVSPDEIVPELAITNPPRMLRTSDGVHFKALGRSPGIISTASGKQRPIGYRAMTSFDGKLFVTATGGLTGDGVLLEVKGAGGRTPSYVQRSPSKLQIFDIQPFRKRLYVGTGNTTTGYGLYASKLSRGNRTWKAVVTGGAGRGPEITSVVSMSVYRGKLYVGASGWYSTLLPSSELIRVNADRSWSLVAGIPRVVPGAGSMFPISGLGDGFGNPFNAHFWRATTTRRALIVGTNDWSYALRGIPVLNDLLRPGFGFDLWGTCDGQYWWQGTPDAFGDGTFNFGLRTAVATPAGLFIGSANMVEGASTWRAARMPACPSGTWIGAAGDKAGSVRSVAQPRSTTSSPTRLITESTGCGTLLSWDATRGARRYVVQRAAYATRSMPAVVAPPLLPNGYRLDGPPIVPDRLGTAEATLAVPNAFETIGDSTGAFFTDRTATSSRNYTYRVVAVSAQGTSAPSNIASDPSLQPKASQSSVRRLEAKASLTVAATEALADQRLRLDRRATAKTKGCR